MTGVDIFLYPSPVPIEDIILSDPTKARAAILAIIDDVVRPGRLKRGPIRRGPERPREPLPVVAHSLMGDLVGRYGTADGRRIYFAMERELKGPFQPGKKYDATRRALPAVQVATPPERVPVRRRQPGPVPVLMRPGAVVPEPPRLPVILPPRRD